MLSVLLYRSEIWVITECIMEVLEDFHHCIAKRTVGKTVRRVRLEVWEWNPMEEDLEAPGLCPMQEYVTRLQYTIEE